MKKNIITLLLFFIIIYCKPNEENSGAIEDNYYKKVSKKFNIYLDSRSIKPIKKDNKVIIDSNKIIKENIIPMVEEIFLGILENKPELLVNLMLVYDIERAQTSYTNDPKNPTSVDKLTLQEFKEKWIKDLRDRNPYGFFFGMKGLLNLQKKMQQGKISATIRGFDLRKNDLLIIVILVDKDNPKWDWYDHEYKSFFYIFGFDKNFYLWTEFQEDLFGED